jgi:hypothetical protein
MKPKNFIHRLLHPDIARLSKRADKRPPHAPKTDRMVTAVLHAVDRTRDEEWSCEDVHMMLDQFADMVNRGESAAQAMPMLQHHLDGCADCREEFESLMRILKASPDA